MEEDRKLLAGIDLCSDYTQISCFNTVTYEPESICQNRSKISYLIPTVLGVKEDTKEWLLGEEALELSVPEEGILITRLLEKIEKEEDFWIYGMKFTGYQILEKYFRKLLPLIVSYAPHESIRMLTITIKNLQVPIRNLILEVLTGIGLPRECVKVISHTHSYLYYALNQKKELYVNDVALFDFDEAGLFYYQIKINRKVSPYLAGVASKDYSEILSYDVFLNAGCKDSLAYQFDSAIKAALYKQLVSTVYVTGKGFEGTWADDTLSKLCIGRRVFKGQNLYAKGACYASRNFAGENREESFVFLTDEMIPSSVSIKLYYDGKINNYMIVPAGTVWFEADFNLEVILDEEEEIEIIISDIFKKGAISQIIPLEGLLKRPDRMTRLEIRIHFTHNDTFVVTIKDLGFGDFYPSTNRIWEKTVTI